MTGQDVFDGAIKLMNEQRDSDGETVISDTADYKNRAVTLINMLLVRAYPYCDTYRDACLEGDYRPVAEKIEALEDEIPMDEAVSAVLCYGLAAKFTHQDDPGFARDMQSEFEDELAMLERKTPVTSEPITDVYSCNEYNEFGRWNI